jgi:hypothetical protein
VLGVGDCLEEMSTDWRSEQAWRYFCWWTDKEDIDACVFQYSHRARVVLCVVDRI